MKKLFVLFTGIILLVTGVSCNNSDKPELTLNEIQFPAGYEPIGNAIPDWVEKNREPTRLYTYSYQDASRFDQYVEKCFPNLSDSEWTQEQSDQMRVGYGIRLFSIDVNKTSSVVYYPILYNDIIVSQMMVYENEDDGKLYFQLSPYFVNELNTLADMTTADTPLYLIDLDIGIAAVIGDAAYWVQRFPGARSESLETEIQVDLTDATEREVTTTLFDKREADVNDWNTLDR